MLLLVLAMADTVSGVARPAMQPAPVVAVAAPAPPLSSPPVSPLSVSPLSVSPVPADTAPATPTAPTPTVVPSAADAGPATADPQPASPTAPPTMADAVAGAGLVGVADGPTDNIAQPRDPWVKLNRGIFAFDTSLERHVLAPVAHGYVHVVPHVVRYHITSALLNLGEPLTAVNDLLQLRIGAMGKTIYRFLVNSTVGVAGLFDVAKTKGGIPIHISDFGQTLGRYGVKPGPYVMIPLLGPSDLRDGFGRIVDNFADPVELFIGGITSPEGISLFLLEGIDWRSQADATLKAVYGATDPYAFVRSAYTQSRAATVAAATGKQAALPDFDAVPGTP